MHRWRFPARNTEDGHALPPRGREWKRAKIAIIVVLVLLVLGAGPHGGVGCDAKPLGGGDLAAKREGVCERDRAQASGGRRRHLAAGHVARLRGVAYLRTRHGYLLHWYADIGARVKQGQLLADLDTPEIDQELKQAAAQREQTASSLVLAKSSFQRWQQLRQRDAVSQQELDERESTYNQDVANLAAADANLQRLKQLESFKRIVAPFAGVVTQRNVDVGDLIDAGSGASRALFALAQSDPLRVYVQLPQAYAQNVKQGQVVIVTQAELPGQQFHGSIANISGAIDVPTRSLQIEVRLPNPDNKLRPGAYVQVALPATVRAPLLVPGNALLFRAEGPRVAVVDQDGKVNLRKIVIAQDLGQSLEIESGIETSDKIIINPSDSIADGDHVLIAPQQPAKKGDVVKRARQWPTRRARLKALITARP